MVAGAEKGCKPLQHHSKWPPKTPFALLWKDGSFQNAGSQPKKPFAGKKKRRPSQPKTKNGPCKPHPPTHLPTLPPLPPWFSTASLPWWISTSLFFHPFRVSETFDRTSSVASARGDRAACWSPTVLMAPPFFGTVLQGNREETTILGGPLKKTPMAHIWF